jgi:H+/Cl- antiporter ClcA
MTGEQRRAYLIALALAALVGVPVAFAATGFTTAVSDLQSSVWTDFPKDVLGYDEPPWWFVLLVPAVGGVLTAGALLLPGRGGHSPADGLSFQPEGIKLAISPVLAAFFALVFGIVLGPEAPLTAIGLALGVEAGRLARRDQVMGAIVALAGGFAAISTVFGGPLPSSLLLFEAVSTSGKFPSKMVPRVLLPGLLAAGVGTLIFTGVRDWSGVHESHLTIPGLPHYGSVKVSDVAISILVALVVAVVVVGARRLGSVSFHRIGGRLAVLVAGGLIVGGLAAIFHEASGSPYGLILFSGENDFGDLLREGSASVLVGVLLAKGAAYAISIGAGFRGGPVFPSVFLGVAVGVLGSVVVDSYSITAGVAVGVAAGGAAALRAPFFGALLSALIVGSNGTNTIPLAIIGAVLAWLVAMATSGEAEPEVPQDGDAAQDAPADPGVPR